MKICFFGNVSPVIEGKTRGGAELQIFLLAKALALKGHEVVVIDPYAEKDLVTVDGIRLLTVPNWNKGLKGLRFFFYRIPALFKTFAAQKADYYYVRMRSFIHFIPYLVATRRGGKFVQAIASDIDVLDARKKYKYEYKSNFKITRFLTEFLPNDITFNFLLKNSDYIALQHTGQKFVTSSKNNQVVFSNIIDISKLPVSKSPKNNYYIYVGSLTMLKGADNLLNLINITDSSTTFMIVGLPKGEEPTEIYKELGKKKNVILKGQKDHKETLELISGAKALINTSYYEGFPNIYLEAWGTGVPVISLTVNPGNIFDQYRLGVCCKGDLDRMKNCIENNEVEQFKERELKAYVEKNHDFANAADRFMDVISS